MAAAVAAQGRGKKQTEDTVCRPHAERPSGPGSSGPSRDESRGGPGESTETVTRWGGCKISGSRTAAGGSRRASRRRFKRAARRGQRFAARGVQRRRNDVAAPGLDQRLSKRA